MRGPASRRAARCCEAARDLMLRISRDFEYESRSDRRQHAGAAKRWRMRKGVCQDFAHIMLGLPAQPAACRRATSAATC